MAWEELSVPYICSCLLDLQYLFPDNYKNVSDHVQVAVPGGGKPWTKRCGRLSAFLFQVRSLFTLFSKLADLSNLNAFFNNAMKFDYMRVKLGSHIRTMPLRFRFWPQLMRR